ncbi:hypothetical protein NVP1063O_199 [Vibrio phage 1.063.O._10N.261.45.C7]|nr:hypothetical protein NVP1063O_199 [Vibrio phage 1.063.O._10N.261.45.C7]
MKNVLLEATEQQLRDLRDYIRKSDKYSGELKEYIIEDISDEIRKRNLEELMKPLVAEFIKERKEKGL